MSRLAPRHLVLTLSGLALAACGETPTQPETGGEPAPPAPSFALASNTWTARAPRPGTPLSGVAAGVVTNSAGHSIVYVFGGADGEGGEAFVTSAYDVTTNTWTAKGPDSRVSVFNSNGVGKIGSKLYFSGGYNYTGGERTIRWETWAYDPATDRLIRKAIMPKATADGVTGVLDGKLYVLPGTCSGDLWPNPGYCEQEPIRRLFRYDPATNAWVGRASSPHFHKQGAAGVINGKFYVAGGFTSFSGSGPVADLDVYDPATNTWRTLAPLPTAGRAIGAVLQGKLFVIAGSGHAYAYNPVTNTWKTKAAPTWGHDALVRVTLDGHPHLLAVGGNHGQNFPKIPNDSELYTP
jgi:N-acetylneuraminic acid mutarotase